jgi:hypothetical protein
MVLVVLDRAAAAETFAGLRDSRAAKPLSTDDVVGGQRIEYLAGAALLFRRVHRTMVTPSSRSVRATARTRLGASVIPL